MNFLVPLPPSWPATSVPARRRGLPTGLIKSLQVSTKTSYFISSLENHPTTTAKAIREHWAIENGLHWCLGIAFREDHCRVFEDYALENLGIVRHMAINLLKRETSLKGGIQAKRLKAAWDHDYLLKVLSA